MDVLLALFVVLVDFTELYCGIGRLLLRQCVVGNNFKYIAINTEFVGVSDMGRFHLKSPDHAMSYDIDNIFILTDRVWKFFNKTQNRAKNHGRFGIIWAEAGSRAIS